MGPTSGGQWSGAQRDSDQGVTGLSAATKAASSSSLPLVVATRVRPPEAEGRTWGDAESIMIDPETGHRLGASDLRSPDSAAVGW